MKAFVLAAPLLLASTTLARLPFKRDQSTDTCAHLNQALVFPDTILDGEPYNAGHIKDGVCNSQVETFVGQSDVARAAAEVVGTDMVKSVISDMINQNGVQCSYPLNAIPSATSNNLCAFTCTNGFVGMPANNPSSCMCASPAMECDGRCSMQSDCTSTPPPSRRQNEPKCAQGLSMCGVPDATSGQAYKCTDITCDSYTCGGCVKASPFGSSSTNGVNCHGIPHVDEVSCVGNKCFVHSCAGDFTVSESNDGCVVKPNGKTVRGLPVPGADKPVDTTANFVESGIVTEELDQVASATGSQANTIVSDSIASSRVEDRDLTSIPGSITDNNILNDVDNFNIDHNDGFISGNTQTFDLNLFNGLGKSS